MKNIKTILKFSGYILLFGLLKVMAYIGLQHYVEYYYFIISLKKDLGRFKPTILHIPAIKTVVKFNKRFMKNKKLKGKYRTPEDLTIISFHNYKVKPLFEVNMDFLGIEYVTIEAPNPYYFINKTEMLHSIIKGGKIKTKYFLICDSKDTMFVDDPINIIKEFEKFDCDILFNASNWPWIRKQTDDSSAKWLKTNRFPMSEVMPKQMDFVNNVLGHYKYLNGGAYMGKTDNVLDILESSMKYITYDDPTTYEVPYGNSDQTMYRWIQPQFHPRMKVDVNCEIFFNGK